MEVQLVLAILFNCLFFVCSSTSNPSVIIIGTGPSGIAAATKLLENNFRDILILEAEPRIGGRINSVKFFDAYVDVGARWCHGQVNNIVYEKVRDMNLLGHNTFSKLMYHSSRKPIDQDFVEEVITIMEEIYETGNSEKVGYRTLGEYCEKTYNKTVYERFKHDRSKLQFALSLMDYFEGYVLGSEGAFSWHDIAALDDYEDCPGDYLLNWNGRGYKIFLDILMKKYPDPRNQLPIDDKILLNKEVTKVEWNQYARKRAVKLRCKDGTVYEADQVIFTPSVGVLKERAQEMFVPRLPQEKLKAIEDIGIGAVMKIIMHFPQVWWENFTAFSLYWSEEDRRSVVREFPEGPNLNGRSWITYIGHILETEKNPNVIVAWVVGPLIPAIEMLPDQTLINGIYFTLNKFLGHKYRIVKPDKIIKSQWYSNPHFRGTYSFQTPEAIKTSAESKLAAPLKNVEGKPIVLFAGEASNPIHYSTVQGAVESGYREANRILDLI